MAEKSKPSSNLIVKLVLWIIDRLERTIFLGLKITLPKKFLSPLGFLGMLTFVVFVILGITGAVLMLYYEPTTANAFDDVENIQENIPYGFLIRNIHYHGSNAMVFLAVAHLYYQYFSGRYKIRNEVIWVTGLILGILTVLEAFTGYDLLYNDRAELAVSIGVSLTNASPVIGPILQQFIWGSGFSEFLVRLYALHVFVIPLMMTVLMLFHFPRFLVLDIPISTAVVGSILIVGGLMPAELGVKFDPNFPPGITVPEWYLTGLYAFIRTGYDKFFTGGVLPLLLILMFFVVPFIDRGRKFSWRDRPFFTAIGLASIAQVLITTVWGFYIDPDSSKPTVLRLFIEPVSFYTLLILSSVAMFVVTYGYLRAKAALNVGKKRTITRPKPITLSTRWTTISVLLLIVFEIYLNISAYMSYNAKMWNLTLFQIGSAFMIFAVLFHIVRAYQPPMPAPITTAAKPPAAPTVRVTEK
ncbi:MAG: cytochrome bc complex cytochrome b subunit [Thaumarchaeota archaeon]|nr:cytochrome bc complex cytochrome b subunit [Nitrososphaerota archaeon]